MSDHSYFQRRSQIESYFDRTAAEAWERLTSDAPVSGVRATVRAGRQAMREMMAGWLMDRLGRQEPNGQWRTHPLEAITVLDAGCGTGLLAVDLARQGAQVLATDLSPKLISVAQRRCPHDLSPGSICFEAGDMLDPRLGRFDALMAMDSLIHYAPEQAMAAISAFAPRIRRSMIVTFVPRTPLLMAMMAVGRLFPRSDRSPAVVPMSETWLRQAIEQAPALQDWKIGRVQRISKGFYTSTAMELIRS
ncbi:MAG: Mg-protoporphyrin methyl transferase BchM [Pseudomonadota bacterium]|jgi:magnesium-protoporphyrin O-methyltransferase